MISYYVILMVILMW